MEKENPIVQTGDIALDVSKQDEFVAKTKDLDDEEAKPGTVYIGHIPHGFYEEQIHDYFTQFGKVNKVRLARSKKTGGYKGYGYVQFQHEVVAQIAADTMNNYLMFDRILKCQFIPEEKLHACIWKGANKKFIWRNPALKHKKLHNTVRSEEELKKSARRLIAKDNKRRKKLLALGINYDFPGYEGAMKKVKKATKVESKSVKQSTAKIAKKSKKL